MVDNVQRFLERMIPELEDLQERGVLSRDEIRSVVKKRRDFEFMLARRDPPKTDFLRYLTYELNLDALRRARKDALGINKKLPSDFGSMQRIMFIFDRAVRKYRGDVRLWLQYIDYCMRVGNAKALSHLFTRALQLHPRNVGLWILAASWEFTDNQNVDAARVLLQRALRINSDSQRLWLEYFRLELLYIAKVNARRMVLELDVDDEKRQRELEVPQLPEEGEEEGEATAAGSQRATSRAAAARAAAEARAAASSAELSQLQRKQAFLRGAVPLVIYVNAIKAIPQDVDFRLQFVDVCDMFLDVKAASGAGAAAQDDAALLGFAAEAAVAVSEHILQSLLRDFPTNEQCWHFCAVRPVRRVLAAARAAQEGSAAVSAASAGSSVMLEIEQRPAKRARQAARAGAEALKPAEAHSMGVFEDAVKVVGTPRMWELFAQHLAELLQFDGGLEPAWRTRARHIALHLASVCERAHAAGNATPLVYRLWSDLARRFGDVAAAEKVAQLALAAGRDLPEAWLRVADLAQVRAALGGEAGAAAAEAAPASKDGASAQAAAAPVLRDALAHVPAAASAELWLRLIEEAGAVEDAGDEDKALAAAERILMEALKSRCAHKARVCAAYVHMVAAHGDLERVLRAVDSLLRCPVDESSVVLHVIRTAIALLRAQPQCDLKQARRMFDKAVAVGGKESPDLWMEYVRFERTQGQPARVSAVYWRAVKALRQSAPFIAMYNS